MANRKFFLMSLLSVGLAMAFQLTALRHAADSVQLLYGATRTPETAEQFRAKRIRVDRRLYNSLHLGIVGAAASALFALTSYRRDEPASQSVIVALLLLYGLLHFAAV
jgi:hypothetical protein